MADPELVEVTQADRDAAAEIVRWGNPGIGNGNKVAGDRIKGGLHDQYAIVQAFARHRIAEQGRCIAAISERRDAYVSAKAPGWREIEHECLQCEIAIRQTGEQR